MSDTTFVDNSTVIVASWLNDVNDTVYGALNAAQTPTAARTALGLGTAAVLNTGTSAGNVVVLDGTAKLPAVDGSQLTNIAATNVDVSTATGTLSVSHGGTGVTTITGILKGNGTAAISAASSSTDYVAPGSITTVPLSMNTNRLLGRTTASSGAVEELTTTEGVQMLSGTVKSDVNGLTEDTTPDTSADFALVYDVSASTHKKVKLNKIGGTSIGQQMVRLNTANGYGSTNTKIRRFTNTVTNTGSDITYADSATNGASFTINTSGVYAISHTDQFTTGGGHAGISINSNQLTTNIVSITASHIGATGYIANTNETVCASVTLYLTAGDVVRCHTNGEAAGTLTNATQFCITRVA